MEKLVIEGGVPLRGAIRVGGSKNAALPIMFASILLDSPITYHNVPRLRDIATTNAMLRVLGCPADFTDNEGHSVAVTPGNLKPEAPYELVKTMRASVWIDIADAAGVQELLEQLDAVAALWIATPLPQYQPLRVFGLGQGELSFDNAKRPLLTFEATGLI